MEEIYQHLFYFYQKYHITHGIIFLTRYLPYFFYISYPLFLIYIYINMSSKGFLYTVVPLCTFIFSSLLRSFLNFPRPYEQYHFEPLLKHTSGQSFPSRHCVCAWILAFTYTSAFPSLTLLCYSIALLISLSRFLSGLHFPKDIIMGWMISGFVAFIFY